jgi:hypothetical protein
MIFNNRGVKMCDKCIGFRDRIRIETPRDYYNLLKQLKVLVEDGVFTCDGEIPLENIKEGVSFPSDYLKHIFSCTTCKQAYSLSVETYHGAGGFWEINNKS